MVIPLLSLSSHTHIYLSYPSIPPSHSHPSSSPSAFHLHFLLSPLTSSLCPFEGGQIQSNSQSHFSHSLFSGLSSTILSSSTRHTPPASSHFVTRSLALNLRCIVVILFLIFYLLSIYLSISLILTDLETGVQHYLYLHSCLSYFFVYVFITYDCNKLSSSLCFFFLSLLLSSFQFWAHSHPLSLANERRVKE